MPAKGVSTWLGILVLVTSACQAPDDVPPSDPSADTVDSVTEGDATPRLTLDRVSDCAGLAVALVDGLQQYVDSFGEVTGSGIAEFAIERQDDLDQLTTGVRAKAEELGCALGSMTPLVERELRRLRGDGPIQTAIANTFRSDPLRTMDPSDAGPSTLTVSTSEELEAALLTLGSGSTLMLERGDFELDETLAVQRPLTIVGAGRSATTLRSSAPGAALVLVSDGDVRLADLTIAHDGDEAASVVVVAAGGYDLDDLEIRGGAAGEDGAGGFGIVLRTHAALLAPGTSRVIRDSMVHDNETGGILVAGRDAPRMTAVRVSGTSGCGVCWAESAGGSLSDSIIEGLDTGVRVEGRATPRVLRTTIRGADIGVTLLGSGDTVLRGANLSGNVTGVSIAGSGRPSIVGNEISGGRIGVQVSGTSTALLESNEVTGVDDAGIAVIEAATPTLRGGRITVEGEVGMLWADEAAGTADDVVVRGPRIGLQVADDATPVLSAIAIEDVVEVAVLAAGRSGGSLHEVRCDDGDGALIVLQDRTTIVIDRAHNCQVVDDRNEPGP